MSPLEGALPQDAQELPTKHEEHEGALPEPTSISYLGPAVTSLARRGSTTAAPGERQLPSRRLPGVGRPAEAAALRKLRSRLPCRGCQKAGQHLWICSVALPPPPAGPPSKTARRASAQEKRRRLNCLRQSRAS
ncbi:unnamed protein product [Prorocentrum cordatum]|uniref:Uncharacterized protein n=1 Tax=Prorocentrum cordatum TaxID=2364126 RepID=A0ABN9YJD6_9DINO|nr:unnamed protein product [Polarella glacialis]